MTWPTDWVKSSRTESQFVSRSMRRWTKTGEFMQLDWTTEEKETSRLLEESKLLLFLSGLVSQAALSTVTVLVGSIFSPRYHDQWDTSDFIHGWFFTVNLISVVPPSYWSIKRKSMAATDSSCFHADGCRRDQRKSAMVCESVCVGQEVTSPSHHPDQEAPPVHRQLLGAPGRNK